MKLRDIAAELGCQLFGDGEITGIPGDGAGWSNRAYIPLKSEVRPSREGLPRCRDPRENL